MLTGVMRVKNYLTIFAILTVSMPLLPAQETEKPITEGLEGWKFFVNHEETPLEPTWTIEADVLKCTGEPTGYLISPEEYENYHLSFDWRWSGEEAGNSGLLVSAIPSQEGFKIWPLCLEVQLRSGDAGDLYFMGRNTGGTVEMAVVRKLQGIPLVHVKSKAADVENPVGEWNTMKVAAQNGELIATVNEQTVATVRDLKPARGRIAFQSEGAPIEIRDIAIIRMPAEETEQDAE